MTVVLPQSGTSPNFDALKQAIEKRSAVEVEYKGFTRRVCPHTIGWKHNREKVLTYQYGGGSSSGLPPGGEWRCMFIDEIGSVTEINDDWHTGQGHSQPQTCVDIVDIETG